MEHEDGVVGVCTEYGVPEGKIPDDATHKA